MKARKVYESIDFRRGEDPYKSLDIGADRLINKLLDKHKEKNEWKSTYYGLYHIEYKDDYILIKDITEGATYNIIAYLILDLKNRKKYEHRHTTMTNDQGRFLKFTLDTRSFHYIVYDNYEDDWENIFDYYGKYSRKWTQEEYDKFYPYLKYMSEL